MTDLPQPTETDIHDWTDPRSFQRGERYYRGGNIINPRRQGNTLRARCTGSRPQPYHIKISLDPKGIIRGDCSCPVGTGGHCKHAVALLLTWLHEPNRFKTVEDLETALGRRSKAELIVLIRRMLDSCPDLETLLELPIVGQTEEPPVDAEVIQRQARSAFAGVGYDEWGTVYGIAQHLLTLVEIGDDYVEIGRWRDAATIYQIVIEETLESYGMVQDESGYLNDVVDRCVEGLEYCLIATEDPLRRKMLLGALFDVYRWDVDFGGVDIGYQAPRIILEQATPEEKHQVAHWVRDALPEEASWGRRAYGHFLLQLEQEWLDDEDYLRICRETGRRQDLVERLLALDRVDEAMAAAPEASDYGLVQLADLFVAQNRGHVAETLIRERMATSRDSRLMVWLKERALARGDREEALALTERLFWQRPSLQRYQDVRALARQMARWDDLRTGVLARLTQKGSHTLLTKIHLDEGELDRALQTLEQRHAESRLGWRDDGLTIRVAQAAEEERPREAIRLYAHAAQALIARRGRSNYAVAATYLSHVRDLYRHLDEESSWETLIAQLRDNNRRLRALKDELNKAGL